jgi:hypothetical protein
MIKYNIVHINHTVLLTAMVVVYSRMALGDVCIHAEVISGVSPNYYCREGTRI